MRFINTSTLRHEKVADYEILDTAKYPNGYAILSHRWGEEGSEIDFIDVSSFGEDEQLNDSRLKCVMAKAGWSKFKDACNLARCQGYGLLWIDTCCIDKRDSVELGEAINSMYRWYSEARVCFAYLEDVRLGGGKNIHQSAWFDRGWTLQELIAPRDVRFYDNSWSLLGDKDTVQTTVSCRTGIPRDVLNHLKSPSAYSIAQRMSWAAHRQTTRIEDAAYSLMGLFDVNIPMIYGEREKAFIRLQEEIIKKNSDQSIFAWDMGPVGSTLGKVPGHCCGMLAPSTACFEGSGNIATLPSLDSFGMGQRGISIKLRCRPYGLEKYLADLGHGICIGLARTQPNGQFTRVRLHDQESIVRRYGDGEYRLCVSFHSYDALRDAMGLTKEFHIRQEVEKTPRKLFPGFWLHHLDASEARGHDIGIHMRILSRSPVLEKHRVSMGSSRWKGTAGVFKCQPLGIPAQEKQRHLQWMKLGFDEETNPICLLVYDNPIIASHLYMGVDDKLFTHVVNNGPYDEYGPEMSTLFDDRWLGFPPEEKSECFDLLRGDWSSGLLAKLSSPMQVKVEIRRQPDVYCDQSTDVYRTMEQDVWTVSITSRAHFQNPQTFQIGRSQAVYIPESRQRAFRKFLQHSTI